MASKADIAELIEKAEGNLISTTPGAVPPHFDDGGHLPFGGTIGNTRGPSAFGKRKMTRANALGNPQALLLNYPPENNDAQLKSWERNCSVQYSLGPPPQSSFVRTAQPTHAPRSVLPCGRQELHLRGSERRGQPAHHDEQRHLRLLGASELSHQRQPNVGQPAPDSMHEANPIACFLPASARCHG